MGGHHLCGLLFQPIALSLTSSARMGTNSDAVAVLLEHSVKKQTMIVTIKQISQGSIPFKNLS